MDPFSLPSVTATVSRQQVRALREGESRGIGEAARHAMQQSEKRVLSEAKVPFETRVLPASPTRDAPRSAYASIGQPA